MNSKRWPNCTGNTHPRIPLNSPTLESHCLISSGPVLHLELQPWELSHSSAALLSSAALGRPRQAEEDGRIKSDCLRPSAPLAPQLPNLPVRLPGPMFPVPPPPLLPAQIGSGPPLVGQVFLHHMVQDPVAFQSSRTPGSRHCSMTGTLPGVVTPPADKLSRCEPSQPSLTMLEPRMEPSLGFRSSEMTKRMTGTGDQNPPGLHVAVPLLGESLHRDKGLQPQSSQVPPRPLLQDTREGASIRQESSRLTISAQSRFCPRRA